MKSMNTKPTGPHQSNTKWGLFVLLAGSLGFTLSMNPDHFNNIARNEYGISGAFNMASETPPAAAAQKDREEQLAQMRTVLKNQKVDDKKIDVALIHAEKLMKENVPLYTAVFAGLKTAEIPESDANGIIQNILRGVAPAEEKAKPTVADTDGASKVKALTDKELDTRIAQIAKQVAKDMAQLPASAQGPANPGTPDQQVKAAQQAAAASKPNGPNSEFGTNSNGRSGLPVSAAPPNEQVPKNQKIFLMSDRTNAACTVSIEQEDGETIGRVEKIEGQTCPLEKKLKFRNASIDDIDAINKMARNMFRDKVNKNETEDGEREEDKAKLASTKEAWEKAQKHCKGKGMDLEDKLDCVQDNFAKLAEDLDDSTQSKNLLKKAYTSSVAPLLKTAMLKPIVTFDRFGRVIINQDPIIGNQMANNLIDSLGDSANATSIISDLERKSMEGLRNQVTMAQNMYSTAKNEQKNPRSSQMGFYKEAASNTFMNQIASIWPDQDLSALVSSVTNPGTYTPGMGGGLTTIPQNMAEARIRAQSQYRGYNVPAPATFGTRSTINGQLPYNQNLGQNLNQNVWNQNLNQNQALPGRGMNRVSGIYTPELTIP